MLGKNGRCAITVDCGRRNLILCHLDDLAGIGCGVVEIATSWWTILYNITVLLCSLLSHLSRRKSIGQSLSHCSNLVRSSCSLIWSSFVCVILSTKESSAKSLDVDKMFSGISLTYTNNCKRPSAVPCGKPDVTSVFFECTPSRTTSCCLSARKSTIQSLRGPLTP